MSELLNNAGYAWTFMLGGALSFDMRVFLTVLLIWTIAGTYYQLQYDPTDRLTD